MSFQTTAIYDNRLLDKQKVEQITSLQEEGDDETMFYTSSGLFAKGYTRIVYGDHGPYIEFDKKHIKHKLRSKFNNSVDYNNLPGLDHKYYYFWLYPEGNPEIKVYLQIKPVHNLPNAPRREDGMKSNFNRVEGYADYKRGYFYVDPYVLQIKKATP